jgi:hypothetical protein
MFPWFSSRFDEIAHLRWSYRSTGNPTPNRFRDQLTKKIGVRLAILEENQKIRVWLAILDFILTYRSLQNRRNLKQPKTQKASQSKCRGLKRLS